MKIEKLIEEIDGFFNKNDEVKAKKLKKLEEVIKKLEIKRKKTRGRLARKGLNEKEKTTLKDEFKVLNELIKKAKTALQFS